jgi:mRNA-degrading endonuclease toxin of MazEF toxin-antitoxin module
MKRGEVWWVSFGPGAEGEIKKERPALIVTATMLPNRHLNRLQVVPFTTTRWIESIRVRRW